MKWTKKKTGQFFMPDKYKTGYKNLTLTLMPPYETGPWRITLTDEKGNVIHKCTFRLQNKKWQDKTKQESIADLETAKKKAFDVMEQYVKVNEAYWRKLQEKLAEMKNSQ